MAQSKDLILVLKGLLRSNDMTYAALAEKMNLSEATIKRIFAEKQLTLDRLEKICSCIGLQLSDLIHIYEENQRRVSYLTLEQEKQLVSDLKLLLIAVCVRNHWSYSDIIQHYEISQAECIRYLLTLEKLGLIELMPENRIKMLVAEDFRWLSKGPIEFFFEKTMQADFLSSRFSKDSERRFFLSGSVSQSSHLLLLEKVEQFAREFAHIYRQDIKLPITERNHIAVVLAVRQWEFSAFIQLRRSK